MKLGFTGTRLGMYEKQEAAFRQLINELKPAEFHHGDCRGADEEAANWVTDDLDPAATFIVSHPPIDPKLRAFACADSVHSPKPYLERNKNIVDETDELVACPGGFGEEQRSGTWSTIRYARIRRKKIRIIWPDGEISVEEARGG